LSHQNSSNSSATSLNFGANEGGWMPVVGDWDANGIDSLGLYQNGIWKIRNTNSSGAPDYNFSFGVAQAGCLPVSIAVNSLP
jgi:hypothetical protein